jgi:hypothetical protein
MRNAVLTKSTGDRSSRNWNTCVVLANGLNESQPDDLPGAVPGWHGAKE